MVSGDFPIDLIPFPPICGDQGDKAMDSQDGEGSPAVRDSAAPVLVEAVLADVVCLRFRPLPQVLLQYHHSEPIPAMPRSHSTMAVILSTIRTVRTVIPICSSGQLRRRQLVFSLLESTL
jgi:hypothetical protein